MLNPWKHFTCVGENNDSDAMKQHELSASVILSFESKAPGLRTWISTFLILTVKLIPSDQKLNLLEIELKKRVLSLVVKKIASLCCSDSRASKQIVLYDDLQKKFTQTVVTYKCKTRFFKTTNSFNRDI